MSWWKNLCYPKMLRFKGHKLKVRQAPEPSTILWENLEYSNFERLRRKGTTTAIAFVMIFFSVIFTFFARDVQETALDKGGLEECPAGWDDLSFKDKHDRVSVVGNEGILHCYCNEMDYIEQGNDATCKE
jgi:hypothetical protein